VRELIFDEFLGVRELAKRNDRVVSPTNAGNSQSFLAFADPGVRGRWLLTHEILEKAPVLEATRHRRVALVHSSEDRRHSLEYPNRFDSGGQWD